MKEIVVYTFLHQILMHFISVEGLGIVHGSSRFEHSPQAGRLPRVKMRKGTATGMLLFYCDSAPYPHLYDSAPF